MKPLHVTYLIGAGASTPELPIAKQIPERIESLDSWLRSEFPMPAEPFPAQENLSGTIEDAQNLFLKNLSWMKLHAANHYSVDTFAKKLFLDDSHALLRQLKATLSTFFYIEQIRQKLHQRYDTFFAAILSGKRPEISLPNNVSILTWNYDSQFEIAFNGYVRDAANVNTQTQATPLPPRAPEFDPNKFSIIHLNGAAGFIATAGHFQRIFQSLTIPASKETIAHALMLFAKYMQQSDSCEPLINFAWETEHPLSQKQLSHALQIAPKTEILVSIGYSFPQFNRGIDRQIIGAMSSLRKVYIQGPHSDLSAQEEKLRSMINTTHSVQVVHRTDLDQFVIPNEF